MLTLQIAGQTLTYKNAPDLNAKVKELLQDTRAKRDKLDMESKDLRKQERMLSKFLGCSKTDSSKDVTA